jgi:integrase
MKPAETVSSAKTSGTNINHGGKFAKVHDGRKQPIRGLWIRNGRYYARLKVENPITGESKVQRVSLLDKEGKPVETVPQAVAAMDKLKTQRADEDLPQLNRTPKFTDYVKVYLESISSGQGAKKPGTREKEKTILGRWSDHKHLGNLRLNQIKRVHVNRFIDTRLKEHVSPRTINLDVIGLRVVLKRALADGLIQRLATDGLKPLKTTTPKRSLVSTAEIEKLCNAACGTRQERDKKVAVTENAQQFVDYIRLMAFSGARRNEALGLRWRDRDGNQLFFRRQVTNRGIEPLKNHEERSINLNPKLRALLDDMKKRNGDASEWIFPSPQRGDKDIPAKTFKETLNLARAAAKMPNFNFHDCRHHFISMCVMSGIDFMTIAAWVGHKDGGVLIGKVYGHLANEHREAMAEKVNFGPAVLSVAV